ncbi:helix-turn-helix transcriptional regulator [Lactobacillus sp. ESL0679]|uniref:helix-turn-helix domain-containing protein n=1 Tax=Lactobacillus sp. ESL0679 TaxID=2983209 RepID=UPI0023F8D00A|nr:helix-turn-helix transcriptional regulator [Lactobacillus sp. ESL0679]MDF7683737.1 helix-turn-helix transcriptional regulator [Lactobacillus sp. ESL0679]
MKTFGTTVKKLRKSRSISQETLAKGLFDRSTLSKIEAGTVSPSRENANEMIARLNVSLAEFEYIMHDYQPTAKQHILYQLLSLESSMDTDKIEQLLNECLTVKSDGDIERIIRILRASLLLNKPHGLSKTKKLVQPIWNNYLSKIKILTITDIYLLNMISYAFDYQTNMDIISKIINIIDNYYPFLKSIKCTVLINQANFQVDQQKIFLAQEALKQAITIAQELGQYDKLIICKAELALCKRDYRTTRYFADLLEEIGADYFAQGIRDEIEEFKAHNSNIN